MLVLSPRYLSCLVLVLSCLACAQQAGAPSSPPSDGAAIAREKEVEKEEQSQRILGVVPMFGVTHEHALPLTPKQKFTLAMKTSYDPFTFASSAFQAGLGQASNEFSGYGQGAEGYGKRFAATYTDQFTGAFFGGFLYPVLFKQDPRFFRLGQGPIKRRIWHAVREEFVCHTDKGGRTFNASNVLGAASSGLLSTLYYPDSDKDVPLALSRAGVSLAYGVAGDMLDEFWPDLHRKLFHKRQKPAPSSPGPGNP